MKINRLNLTIFSLTILGLVLSTNMHKVCEKQCKHHQLQSKTNCLNSCNQEIKKIKAFAEFQAQATPTQPNQKEIIMQ